MRKILVFTSLLLLLNGVKMVYAQTNVPIYLYFASHNETNDQTFHSLDYSNATDYATMRAYVQRVCDTIISYNAKYEMMLESNFILGCLKNENAATNPNDIIEWADNHANIEVQPHNHFKPMPPNANPYNYADLCHLLDSCGLTSTSEVMGGFIWRSFTSPTTVNEDWTQWQIPKAGNTFPTYSWSPTLLWGGGSPNHIDDYDAYGVWKPKAATLADFGTHDASKTLVNFGNGCGERFVIWDTTDATLLAYRIMNFADSAQAHFATNPNAFFNMKIMLNFRDFPTAGYIEKIGQVLRIIQPYINSNKIQYKGIMESYQAWQSLHPNPNDYFVERCENSIVLSNVVPTLLTTAIEASAFNQEWKIYPNPASDKLVVQNANFTRPIVCSIVDMCGRVVHEETLSSNLQSINISNLTAGIYVLQMNGGYVQKFVKITKL